MPATVFGATVKFPLASILNGPLLTGVTSVLTGVAGAPLTVSFAVTFPPVAGKESLLATIALFTTTVAIARVQFDGIAPTSQISYSMLYVPLGVFGATVKFPSASILNGPFVTGVTSVLAGVAGTPLTVSFAVTFPPAAENVLLLATIGLLTTTVTVAVVQFAGVIPV